MRRAVVLVIETGSRALFRLAYPHLMPMPLCAFAWWQRHRPAWRVYCAVIDPLATWFEPHHTRASYRRMFGED